MPRALDELVVGGLEACFKEHGHVFPDAKQTHEGKQLRNATMFLVERVERGHPPVHPSIIKRLRALGCPLTKRGYALGWRLNALQRLVRAGGPSAVPPGDLRMFMRSLQTTDGSVPPHVSAALRDELEALPNWTWTKRRTPKRSRTRVGTSGARPPAAPKMQQAASPARGRKRRGDAKTSQRAK